MGVEEGGQHLVPVLAAADGADDEWSIAGAKSTTHQQCTGPIR
jgi:hypothetical protein